jgi:hypothetical protein
MTPEEIRLREQLYQTELALDDATNNIEYVRAAMHSTILQWRKEGWSWRRIKATELWKAFIKIGGS